MRSFHRCSSFLRQVALSGLVLLCANCGSNSTTGPSTTQTLTVSFASATAVGGTAPVQGTVSLSPAPSTPATITLSSSIASAASVPTTVTVPAGAVSATFSLTTLQVQLPVVVRITATLGSLSQTADFGVEQIPTCGPFLTAPVMMPFFVYADAGDPRNHFVGSGFFGDLADLTLDVAEPSSPQSGTTSMKIDYQPRGPQGFAGIFFQCPANNFGTVNPAGFDLSLARQIRGYIRAAKPGQVELKVGGLGAGAPFPDSLPTTSTNPVVMSVDTTWREFIIDVTGGNRSHMISGLMIVTSIVQNPSGNTFFLDDISWQ